MAKFSNKHYEAVAKELKYCNPKGYKTRTGQQQFEFMVRCLDMMFAEDNPRFDGQKFRKAVMGE